MSAHKPRWDTHTLWGAYHTFPCEGSAIKWSALKRAAGEEIFGPPPPLFSVKMDAHRALARRSPATGGAGVAQRAARGGSVTPDGREPRRARLSMGGGHAVGHGGAAGAQPGVKAQRVGAVAGGHE